MIHYRASIFATLKHTFFLRRPLAALCLALSLAACKGPAKTAESPDNSAGVERSADFAFRFLQEANAATSDSYVVSPVSLEYLLGMLQDGAKGRTAEELSTVLGGHPVMNLSLPLEMANAIVVNRRYPLLKDYQKTVEADWRAWVKNMDFDRQKEVLAAINGWCDRKTHGLIPQILDEVSPDMMAVLMNAVYFKQSWTDPFRKEATREEPFTAENGAVSTVPLMYDRRNVDYTQTEKFQMIHLPYGDGGTTMSVLLPKKGVKTADLLKDMTASAWNALQDSLHREDVRIYLPRFETKTHLRLNEMLAAMGMPTAFTGNADFKGMFATPAFVSLIQQDAFIRNDEEGTEAAAVTSAVMKVTCCLPVKEPVVFRADHSFLYFICDKNGTILFAGRQ